MEGIVEDINNVEGTFTLKCKTSILLVQGNFDYIKLDFIPF